MCCLVTASSTVSVFGGLPRRLGVKPSYSSATGVLNAEAAATASAMLTLRGVSSCTDTVEVLDVGLGGGVSTVVRCSSLRGRPGFLRGVGGAVMLLARVVAVSVLSIVSVVLDVGEALRCTFFLGLPLGFLTGSESSVATDAASDS